MIFVINLLYANVPLVDNLMTAVVLGVAAVPETLPVIVTLSLIYGVENMAQKKLLSETFLPLKLLEMQQSSLQIKQEP